MRKFVQNDADWCQILWINAWICKNGPLQQFFNTFRHKFCMPIMKRKCSFLSTKGQEIAENISTRLGQIVCMPHATLCEYGNDLNYWLTFCTVMICQLLLSQIIPIVEYLHTITIIIAVAMLQPYLEIKHFIDYYHAYTVHMLSLFCSLISLILVLNTHTDIPNFLCWCVSPGRCRLQICTIIYYFVIKF